jgi:hypothetical protein
VDGAVGGLAEVIASLREELSTALAEGEGERLQFALSPVELTVQVALSKQGQGKIGWGVLGVGASVESGRTNTLTVTLTPMLKQADGTLTTDFTISDVVPADEGRDAFSRRNPGA